MSRTLLCLGDPPYYPAALPGAFAIYDTRYGVTTATGVSGITSRKAGGPALSQATGGLQPLLHPRQPQLGNKPAMLFDGATLYRVGGLSAADWKAFHGSADHTIVAFSYLNAGSAFRAICGTSQGGAANVGFLLTTNGSNVLQNYVTNGTVSEAESGPTVSPTSIHMMAVRKSGTQYVMNVDGTQSAPTTQVLSPSSADPASSLQWGVAIAPGPTATLPWSGAHTFLYLGKQALSDTQIGELRTWLRAQWEPERILYAGDSTTVGSGGLVGGFRLRLQDQLIAQGMPFTTVGPSGDGFSEGGYPVDGKHYGVGGVTQASRLGGVLTGVMTTYPSEILVLGFGVNDIGGGTKTGAQALADTETLIGEVVALNASQRIVIRDCLKLASYPAYAANEAERLVYNAGLDALATAQRALGRRVVRWALTSDPTTSDGLHPDDTATGYPSMAVSGAAAIQAVRALA